MVAQCLEVTLTSSMEEMRLYRNEPGFQQMRDARAMRSMAEALRPLVTVNDLPPDERLGVQVRHYSIVVGDLSDQQKFDAAVERRAQEIAERKIADAQARAVWSIEHWGSEFGWASIKKDDALRFIREAFRKTQ